MAPHDTSLPLSGVDPRAIAASTPSLAGGHGAAGAYAQLNDRRAAVLTAQRSTAAFQTLGMTWLATSTPPDLLIAVRTRAAVSQQWTAWTPLDQDDDDANPDPVTASGLSVAQARAAGLRGGTGSLWAGPSTGVQVRVEVRSGAVPADLRLELIDPGTSAADAAPAPSPPSTGAAGTTLPDATASTTSAPSTPSTASTPSTGTASTAGVGEPEIFSRQAWGADESRVRNAPTYMPTIKAAVIHHTAGPNNYARAQVPGIIRGDFAYHLTRGWSDIGYNALVDRFGRVWEGRAGGLTRNVMGAHAGGFNSDTFGVSVIGNYDVSRPTSASVEAVARVIAWKIDVHHRDPFGTTRLTSAGGGTARYRSGTTVTLPVVMGHRNTGFTACPGRYLYPYLPAIRQRIRSLIGTELINPSSSPATTSLGSPVWVSARALTAQSWNLTVTSSCSADVVARASGHASAGQAFTATWDGKLADGSQAVPGEYTLTLGSRSRRGAARPVSRTVLIQPPAVPDAPPGTPSTGPGGYQPLTPARLAGSDGSTTMSVWPRGRADVPVLGRGGVPASGVTAVALNVTISCPSSPAGVDVWPTGGTRTGHTVTAVAPGTSRSVLVTSQVGAGGSVSISTTAGVAQVTADVVGYFTASGSALTAVRTTRVLETGAVAGGGPVDAGSVVSASLPGTVAGVASSHVTAVLADISAIGPTGSGTLTAYPPGANSWPATLPFRSGRSSDNLAIVPVQAGTFMVRASGGATNVTVDIRGIVTDGSVTGNRLTVTTPVQVMNVKSLAAGSPRTVTVIGGATGVPATGVTGVIVALTTTDPAATASLEVYPSGTTAGPGAAMRVFRGDTRGTVMLVPVDAAGKVTLKLGAGHSGVRMDVRGYLS